MSDISSPKPREGGEEGLGGDVPLGDNQRESLTMLTEESMRGLLPRDQDATRRSEERVEEVVEETLIF